MPFICDPAETKTSTKKSLCQLLRDTNWHVSDESEFKKLHREFLDQYLKKAGAKEMLMNQESSGSWLNYQVDVIFEDWSGKNAWNDFFNTE